VVSVGQFRDYLSTEEMNREDIEEVLSEARWMLGVLDRRTSLKMLSDKIMATLFFQSSTRTRLSFESAMHRLGGSVIGFADVGTSRASGPRAETLADTIRTVDPYCDVMVLRHPQEGAARMAAELALAPVLNGGDGTNQHPSQGLLDTFTIWYEKGGVDDLTIGMVGDLGATRGMHSLVHCLSNYRVKLIFVAPSELRFDEDIKQKLAARGVEYEETEELAKRVTDMDVMYVTRLNKEGAGDRYGTLLPRCPRVNLDSIAGAKPGLIIMHDLPRTDELGLQIDDAIDGTCHAKYFEEVKYGVAVRMAMLAIATGRTKSP
jgi:aspartate carbamoyltransferase catalytic subunit